MNAQTRSEISELLRRHGVTPSRRLGQHFLADANITRKIVDLAGVGPGDRVVEIGAGTGTLTRALADAGARVVAYEVDPGLAGIVAEVTAGLDVEIRVEDVTKTDFGSALEGDAWSLVSNLPYNVGTPVVLDIMQSTPAVVRFVVMVQLEVAERFVASAGSEAYGLPSVVTALHTVARIAFRVPPQVFFPPPRVDSAVVAMDRKPAPGHAAGAIEIARAGFGQRRKMLRRSLARVLGNPAAVLEAAGIDPRARAEELAPEDFVRIAGAAA
jgi:16S rRNA (adenine1518-N6/adenine1519-N6)-dimethyltransferase